ncbi:MAG TPA: ATPase, T2SS/T4P/T4SS family [Chthonomonadales bacterium]|nr:ATPase, T2SS/T4P/T4SS family [Chthonomonadales bacterium]
MIESLKALQNRTCRLGEQLIADGLIDEQQLRQSLEHQRHTGAFLGETLVALGFVSSAALGRYLEAATGFPFVNLAEHPLNQNLAHLVPEHVARRKRLLPIAEQGDTIHLAMADPLDLATLDDLRARLNRRIVPFLALEADLNEAINRVYDVRHKTQSVLDEITELPPAEQDLSVDELVGLAEDAPIVRLVNTMVQSALDIGASDIHIEPQEPCVRVRFRLDGLLYDQMTIPTYHQAAVISRIKIMARLNIAERRRPQDGRFSVKDTAGKEYDLRVSIMPTIYGEKVVMRILEKSSSFAVLEKLGFWSEQRKLFESFIHRPHGIVLVTGPTGSGKSTTLYAALHRINDSTLNINTIEDPVEYHLKGVNQVQVNPKIGVTFASGLRTLVRQDPDVIMVGEIRDLETAEIAIQAALTGHLVLSTLHTNDAPGALVRLQHMGVEPFLISSAVIGVVGQRLVRTVCPHCKETRPASSATVAAFGLPHLANQTPVFAEGRGCGRCNGLGMKGRTGVFEVMQMSDALREMVLQRASGATLRGQAIAQGMMTMRDAAILKVLEGITTPEEVARVIYAEE